MKTEKTIAIIGGGLTGVLVALLLKKMYNGLYSVAIYDAEDDILKGASYMLARLHMGGEYPKDEGTSNDCVKGAFLFAQVFPRNLFSDIIGIDYLVTNDSVASKEEKNKVSVETLFTQYKKNIDFYQNVYNSCLAFGYKHPFGLGRNFYEEIDAKKISGNFAGGISTNEWGFNSSRLKIFIEDELRNVGVKVYLSSQVFNVEKNGDYNYTLFFYKEKKEQRVQSKFVVNASWQNSLFLDSKVRDIEQRDKRTVYNRCFATADISNCKFMRPSFALIGEYGGMFSPIDEKKAILYVPSEKISHLSEQVLDNSNFQLKEWDLTEDDLLNDNKRKEEIKSRFISLYPSLTNISIEKMHARPTVSFDDKVEKRSYRKPEHLIPGWITAISTKGTYAVRTALDTIKLIHPEIERDILNDMLVPEKLRF